MYQDVKSWESSEDEAAHEAWIQRSFEGAYIGRYQVWVGEPVDERTKEMHREMGQPEPEMHWQLAESAATEEKAEEKMQAMVEGHMALAERLGIPEWQDYAIVDAGCEVSEDAEPGVRST